MRSREAANTLPGIKPKTFHTPGENANPYTTQAVSIQCKSMDITTLEDLTLPKPRTVESIAGRQLQIKDVLTSESTVSDSYFKIQI